MAGIEHIHVRLVRWGSWRQGGGVGRSEGVARYEVRIVDSASDGLWSTRVPFDTLEAGETDRAVAQLPELLRAAVIVTYAEMPGHTNKARAARLRVSDQTLRMRVEHAQARIDAWLQDKHEAAQTQQAARAAAVRA